MCAGHESNHTHEQSHEHGHQHAHQYQEVGFLVRPTALGHKITEDTEKTIQLREVFTLKYVA